VPLHAASADNVPVPASTTDMTFEVRGMIYCEKAAI
jgi:hypothetical protein